MWNNKIFKEIKLRRESIFRRAEEVQEMGP
jgi:hypothetical protein